MSDSKRNLNVTKNKNGDKSPEKNNMTWGTLLPDLLKLVLSLLCVRDNIRASAVCKTWYNGSAAIRAENKHPWLVICSFSPERPSRIYDPIKNTAYMIQYPEFIGMHVYHAKNGWMLMGRDQLSFFNPFTRELISLPDCEEYIESAIFVGAPTSNDCMVFGLSNIGRNNASNVGVNTLRIRDTKWKTNTYDVYEYFFCNLTKIVFSDGLFYCLAGLGSVAVFDPTRRTFRTNKIPCGGREIKPVTSNWISTYMTEIKGEIVLLKVFDDDLRVFVLKGFRCWSWEEITERVEEFLEGLTIFGDWRAVKYVTEDLKSNTIGKKILLLNPSCKKIQTYEFKEGRYQLSDLSNVNFICEFKKYQSVWIEPPKPTRDSYPIEQDL